jgi:shikimate kinase
VDDRRHPARNILLTGFDQCGKTATGREVARQLRRHFVDFATELERRKRALVPQLRIFRSDPNPAELNARLVNDLSYKRETVIALAADTLETPDYRSELEVFSFIVFLDPPFDALWARLKDKPAAAATFVALGRDTVHALWHERRAQYERCELQLTNAWLTPAQAARLIVHCFYS